MSVTNVEKLFQYLNCVAKKPTTYSGQLGRSKIHLEAVIGDKIDLVKLNKTFFYNDSCQNCGGCDPAEANVFTESELQRIKECSDDEFTSDGLDPSQLHNLLNGLYEESHIINGKEVSVYVYPRQTNELYLPVRQKVVKRCAWCFQEDSHRFKCKIHPVESITCVMPHLRFYHQVGSSHSSMGIHQFGRNWALGCPVTLTPPENESQFYHNKQDRLDKLHRLNQCGLDLNIETYLPEVIEYVEKLEWDNYEDYLERNILKPIVRSIKLF